MFGLEARQPSVSPPVPSSDAHRDVINRYCISCHNGRLKTGGLALDTFVAADVAQNPEAWEKVDPEDARAADASGWTAAAG